VHLVTFETLIIWSTFCYTAGSWWMWSWSWVMTQWMWS